MIIALIAIAALVVILVLWGIVSYNNLVKEHLKVENQWSQVDIVLKQRAEVIPNLVETVKGYAAHEKEALQAVTEARNRYLSAGAATGKIDASGDLSGALSRLMAVAEAYPELKANGGFVDLQRQIGELETKIADFRQFYNDTVMRYNRLVVTVPSSLIARLFHFEKEPFFMVEEADKTVPDVQF